MIESLRHLLGWIFIAFSSRDGLILENLALRQQLLCPTSAEMGQFETLS